MAPPFHRPGWVFEEKLDGWRIVASKIGSRVRLVSRTDTDHTRTFPQLAAAVAALPAETLILDGEVCAFDQALVSHMRLLRDAEPDEIATPPMYGAFDYLHVNGRDLRALPLRERRAILGHELGEPSVLFPVRRLATDGLNAWAEVQRRGLEGLVAKPEASRYVSGARGVWRKVKVRREGVFVLAGIAKDRDGRMVLVVGVREGRAPRYAGVAQWISR